MRIVRGPKWDRLRDTTTLIRRATPSAASILRSVVLGAVVFTLAALTGVLLSGTAPAGTLASEKPSDPGDAEDSAAVERSNEVDPTFAQSMVFSGTAALTVSVMGLVMVGRRRRLW